MARNSIKQLLLIIACLLTSLSGFALDYESFIVDGIGYKILSLDDRTVAVTYQAQHLVPVAAAARGLGEEISQTTAGGYVYQYTDVTYSGKVVIPATVTYEGITYTVTEIATWAFYYSSSLSSLTIPNTINYFPSNNVIRYKSLQELIIEDGDNGLDWDSDSSPFRGQPIKHLYLGRNLLKGGNSYDVFGTVLESVEIGDQVTSLVGGLFKNCSQLTTVRFGRNITSMGWEVFSKCTSLASIDLTSSLTTIIDYSFYGCSSLQHITLPQGVTSIKSNAFGNCAALEQVALPKSLTAIGNSAFNGSGLTEIHIPQNVTSIDSYAFNECPKLKDVIIEDGETSIEFSTSSNYPAFKDSPIDSMYVGRNFSSAPTFNRTIRVLAFGDNVTWLGYWQNQSNLMKVYFGKNISSANEYAFEGCTSLKHIDMTSKLKAVPYRTFYNCTALESVILPSEATYLGGKLFEGCTSLKSISIPGKVTEIGYYAFDGCTSLKDVVFEDGEQDLVLESYNVSTTFNQCPIDSVYLGRNLKKKKDSGSTYYYYNSLFPASLTKLTIGSNVTTQWDYRTFQNCSELTHVHPLWEQPISTNKNMFPDAVYTNATLLVPGGTVKKYQATAAWNEFANIVPTSIGVTMTATVGGSISLGDVTVTDDTRLLQVKPNSVLTFEITPEETHFLKSLVMNETDVTSQVVNGQFTPTDLSEDIELTATFTAKPYYSVSATAAAGGTATVGSASVMWGNGTTVTLTAGEGYMLKVVTVNGTDKTSEVVDGVLTLSDIKENKAVVATFQKLRFAVTTAECENGSISLSANEVEWDASATAAFTPAAHYEVATVSVNGEDRTAQLNNNQLTIANIRQATTIGATFRLQTFTITETHNEGGTVLLSAETAPWGSSVTVTITPDNEHFLEHVAVNGVDVTNGVANGEHTITVGDNTTVAVTFAAKPYYSVTVTASAGGTAIAGSTSVMWGCGTTVTLTPDECYELVSVTVNGVDKTNEVEDGVLTLEDIQEDIAVDAAFGVRTATITISSAGEGTYCGDHDLDFSGVQGLKAYIASGFIQKSGTVILTHVTDVPAGTGLMVKGPQGTYEVPFAESTAYYSNMFKGNVEPVYVDPTESSYTNFYLSNGSNGLGFYRITNTRRMSANRAILQLPTSIVGEARVLDIFFEDEDTSGIGNLTISRPDDALYDLQGRKVEEPAKGLYIKNGKKIIIK